MLPRHQISAYSALRNAIGSFSQANADAVFAASIILSWQAQNWLVISRGSRVDQYLLCLTFKA